MMRSTEALLRTFIDTSAQSISPEYYIIFGKFDSFINFICLLSNVHL